MSRFLLQSTTLFLMKIIHRLKFSCTQTLPQEILGERTITIYNKKMPSKVGKNTKKTPLTFMPEIFANFFVPL